MYQTSVWAHSVQLPEAFENPFMIPSRKASDVPVPLFSVKLLIPILFVQLSFLPAFGQESDSKVVFYVMPARGAYELRIYRPETGSEVMASPHSEPQNLFWHNNYSALYYRIGDKVYQLEWKKEANAVEVLTLPDNLSEEAFLWIDDKTGRIRFYEIRWPREEAVIGEYFDQKGRWKILAREKTEGCKSPDVLTCGMEVRKFTKGQKRSETVEEISHDMRIWNPLSRQNMMLRGRQNNQPIYFPSKIQSHVYIQVLLNMEKSLHALAPVYWMNAKEGVKREVYGKTTAMECSDKIGFMEHDRWLLVASEYGGQCGRIVDMTTGEIMMRLPELSSMAVWVPDLQP